LGTMRYICNFFINNLIIQVMYLILSLILLKDSVSCGIIPVMFAEITILSFANPNNVVSFLYIPIHFKAVYYPFIVFGVFWCINLFKIYIDAICGIIYGLLFIYCFRPYLVITDESIEKISKLIPCSFLEHVPGKFQLI
jgi:hypothetical protein